MNRPIAGAAALAVISVLTLAAPQAHAAGPDACKLIDPALAGKILNTQITVHPMDTSAAGNATSMCHYAAGELRGGFTLLAAQLPPGPLGPEVTREKQEVLDSSTPPGVRMPKPQVRDLSGVGEAAFLVTMGEFFQIHAFANGAKIVVNRNAKPTPAAIDQGLQLARAALAHLH